MKISPVILALSPLLLTACNLGFTPDYPKLVAKLSDENYNLTNEVGGLKGKLKDKDATIEQLRDQIAQGRPGIPTLPKDRLNELFTVGSIEIRPGTTAIDSNSDGKLDAFRVLIRPHAQTGETLPATGTLVVEAFDLAITTGSNRIGKWTFPPIQLKTSWYDGLGLNQFGLTCPWETTPAHPEITLKIQFTEALTGYVFTAQQIVKVSVEKAEAPK